MGRKQKRRRATVCKLRMMVMVRYLFSRVYRMSVPSNTGQQCLERERVANERELEEEKLGTKGSL